MVWRGAEAAARVAVGDEVMADGLLTGPRSRGGYQAWGGWASYAVAPVEAVLARPRGLSPRPVAEVESVQTILSLVARGVGDTVLPASAARDWPQRGPLHVAPVVSPAMRNRLVLAVPTARPATRLTRWATQLLRELATRQFGGRPGQGG